jgi:pimeloyl-ACP methyl ester carboxylesterase
MSAAFTINWAEDQVERLKAQIAAPSLPAAPEGAGWTLGCDRDFLERFRQHWLHHYDWRAAMAELNRYPQFVAEIDGQAIHFVHVRSGADGARPLLLTHGWPGSFYEFWSVIEPLTAAGFDLVIPSLPGYAFSGKPAQPIGPKGTAVMWDRLMREVLGYRHYLAQGGDWGALVTTQIGLDNAGGVRGIHLNMLGLRSPEPPRNEEEQAWMSTSAAAQQRLSGYSAVQMMKPLSLGWLAAGKPAWPGSMDPGAFPRLGRSLSRRPGISFRPRSPDQQRHALCDDRQFCLVALVLQRPCAGGRCRRSAGPAMRSTHRLCRISRRLADAAAAAQQGGALLQPRTLERASDWRAFRGDGKAIRIRRRYH